MSSGFTAIAHIAMLVPTEPIISFTTLTSSMSPLTMSSRTMTSFMHLILLRFSLMLPIDILSTIEFGVGDADEQTTYWKATHSYVYVKLNCGVIFINKVWTSSAIQWPMWNLYILTTAHANTTNVRNFIVNCLRKLPNIKWTTFTQSTQFIAFFLKKISLSINLLTVRLSKICQLAIGNKCDWKDFFWGADSSVLICVLHFTRHSSSSSHDEYRKIIHKCAEQRSR